MKKIFAVLFTLVLMACGNPAPVQTATTVPATPTTIPTATIPTPTPTFTETPTPTVTEIPVLFTPNQVSNCRFGPNMRIWSVLTVLNKGQSVLVIGRSEPIFSGPWWKVESPQGECWVYSKLGSTTGNESQIQEAPAPFPVYTLTPTLYVLRTITIKNNQNVAVCEVGYKSIPESENFRKLEFAGPIQPGKSAQALIAQDLYYFRFLDCDGYVLETTPLVVIDYYSTVISTP
jgi:hypothetical protein